MKDIIKSTVYLVLLAVLMLIFLEIMGCAGPTFPTFPTIDAWHDAHPDACAPPVMPPTSICLATADLGLSPGLTITGQVCTTRKDCPEAPSVQWACIHPPGCCVYCPWPGC